MKKFALFLVVLAFLAMAFLEISLANVKTDESHLVSQKTEIEMPVKNDSELNKDFWQRTIMTIIIFSLLFWGDSFIEYEISRKGGIALISIGSIIAGDLALNYSHKVVYFSILSLLFLAIGVLVSWKKSGDGVKPISVLFVWIFMFLLALIVTILDPVISLGSSMVIIAALVMFFAVTINIFLKWRFLPKFKKTFA